MSHHHHEGHALVHGKGDGKHEVFNNGNLKIHAHVKHGKVAKVTGESSDGRVLQPHKIYRRRKP